MQEPRQQGNDTVIPCMCHIIIATRDRPGPQVCWVGSNGLQSRQSPCGVSLHIHEPTRPTRQGQMLCCTLTTLLCCVALCFCDCQHVLPFPSSLSLRSSPSCLRWP